MNVKKELIEMLFSKRLNFERDTIYVIEYMPFKLVDSLESLIKADYKNGTLNIDLNEWELNLKEKYGTLAVAASKNKGVASDTMTTAIFHIDLKDGEVILKGIFN